MREGEGRVFWGNIYPQGYSLWISGMYYTKSDVIKPPVSSVRSFFVHFAAETKLYDN